MERANVRKSVGAKPTRRIGNRCNENFVSVDDDFGDDDIPF